MIELKKTSLVSIGLLLFFSALLIWHTSYYYPFISDDALISLRYAERFLAGQGLTWTAGEAVEGYSNLLWILLSAFLGALGMDLVDSLRVLGITGMIVIFSAIIYGYRKQDSLNTIWFPIVVGLLFLALAAPIAVWAIGGLEQPLYGALLAVSIPLMYHVLSAEKYNTKVLLSLSFTLGLLCITRPDGALFTITSVITLLLVELFYKKNNFKEIASKIVFLSIFPILFYGGQLIFRLSYYGEFVPNTALVKLNPSIHNLLQGIEYFLTGIQSLAPFSYITLVALIVLMFFSHTRVRATYLLITAALWSVYIIVIGGDIFPAHRHFIPLVVIFAFILVEGSYALISYLRTLATPYYTFIFIIIGFILFIPYVDTQFESSANKKAIYERWEWEGKEIATILKDAFSTQQPLLAVTAAGCLPYWSKLPSLDMLGLNDYYLPRHPPKDIGNGFLGHELGEGRYTLERNPDIMIFNIGSSPYFRVGSELLNMPAFYHRYVPISLNTSYAKNQLPIIYFNRYSEKIGIIQTDTQIKIPGFLLAGEGSFIRLNTENKLVSILKAGQVIKLDFDVKADHTWDIQVKASITEGIRSKVSQHGKTLTLQLSANTDTEIEEVVLNWVN